MLKNRITYPLCLLIVISLCSCEKQEKPIKLPAKPDSVSVTGVEMGENYDKQVFVDLETGQSWSVDNTAWDLQFESSESGSLITMNGGNSILIGNTGYTSCSNLLNQQFNMRWDNSSGMKDSIVLGNWLNTQTNESYDSVYIIDRGPGADPSERFFQFQVESVDDKKYKLRIADIDGKHEHEEVIQKNADKVHVYFTFSKNGRLLDFEPDKNSWHFTFLHYRWIYYQYNPPLLYLVSGVHINTSRVRVAIDSTMNFYDIKEQDVIGIVYKDSRDVIGFDWKYPIFSATGVTYACRKYENFIIVETSGASHLYKLRFIDYYNSQGVKGSPKFEYQQLR